MYAYWILFSNWTANPSHTNSSYKKKEESVESISFNSLICAFTLFLGIQKLTAISKKKNYLLVIHKNYVKKEGDEVLDMKGVFKSEFQSNFFYIFESF